MILDPEKLTDRNRYKFASGAILPRPIAWVSTMDGAGNLNLAPFSFFTCVSVQPFTLLFCPMISGERGEKDTLRNVREVPEFVIQLVSEGTVAAMSKSAALLPRGESEFAYAGVTPVKSETIRVPRVAEAPIAFECKLREVVTVGEGSWGGSAVFGDVQSIFVRDDVYEDSYIVRDRLRPVGRLAGHDYVRITDVFESIRG